MDFDKYHYNSRRSNVVALNGMVAASQPLAAQAGLEILQAGGNAVDAAVASAATLCVTEPGSTGPGGDAFALIWSAAQQKLFGLNASGPAPAGISAEMIRNQGWTEMPESGPLTITVPGAVKGWQAALQRFGTLPLRTLLQRPIEYAREGFPVSQIIARSWARTVELLASHPDSARTWLVDGRAPRAGEIFTNPGLAATLEELAERGLESFYQGRIAREIVRAARQAGSPISLDDLAGYDVEWIEPIGVAYADQYTFHEMPPNGQGLTALMALTIVREFGVRAMDYGSPDYWHLLIEAIKLAFADARAFISDPRMAQIPVQELLSEAYVFRQRQRISMEKAQLFGPGNPKLTGDTVYLTVADRWGNMVSWIQSLYENFGSGITAEDTGVVLQNRGANFTLEVGHPNQIAPGKRPYHTIIPGFITRDGLPWSSFGVMGGFMQPQGHLQVGLNLVDFGMDPQSALDAPRFRWIHDRLVVLEPEVPADVLADLRRRGHELMVGEESRGISVGGGQIILREPSGVLVGGSDSRKDGQAVGF